MGQVGGEGVEEVTEDGGGGSRFGAVSGVDRRE